MTRVFVAGHRGMVGSAICRKLADNDDIELIVRDRHQLDLTSQSQVRDFFSFEKIDQIYLAAAKVGGIHANNIYPAEFIYNNLMIQTNIVHQAFLAGVKNILFLGSSCIYPKLAKQPMQESSLLTGLLEPTNEPYAIAKIAGIKLCESYNRQYGDSHGIDYRCVMPTNLYGPGDNFHETNSHVIPALIRKFCAAVDEHKSSVTIWGTGKPYREFLHVEDMASASIFVMQIPRDKFYLSVTPMNSHINVGYGSDISIANLAIIIAELSGYQGNIQFDDSMPDGTPKKLMDCSLLNSLGWNAEIDLKQGLRETISFYRSLQIEAPAKIGQ